MPAPDCFQAVNEYYWLGLARLRGDTIQDFHMLSFRELARVIVTLKSFWGAINCNLQETSYLPVLPLSQTTTTSIALKNLREFLQVKWHASHHCYTRISSWNWLCNPRGPNGVWTTLFKFFWTLWSCSKLERNFRKEMRRNRNQWREAAFSLNQDETCSEWRFVYRVLQKRQ